MIEGVAVTLMLILWSGGAMFEAEGDTWPIVFLGGVVALGVALGLAYLGRRNG